MKNDYCDNKITLYKIYVYFYALGLSATTEISPKTNILYIQVRL